jgi:hypothetical protein
MYLAVAAFLVVGLTLPVVVATRAFARAATRREERGRDELGAERRSRLEAFVRV